MLKIFKHLLNNLKSENFGSQFYYTFFYIENLECSQIWRISHDNYKDNTNYHLCLNRAKFDVFKCC